MQSNVGTYGRRIHIYPTVTYLDYVKFHQQHAREKKLTIPCGYIWREKLCLYSFTDTFIWLMFLFVTAETRPAVQ